MGTGISWSQDGQQGPCGGDESILKQDMVMAAPLVNLLKRSDYILKMGRFYVM